MRRDIQWSIVQPGNHEKLDPTAFNTVPVYENLLDKNYLLHKAKILESQSCN